MHNQRKGQQVGTRAFRCGYKDCGRLYTTAHHLKVKQVTWQCTGQSSPSLHCQRRMIHSVQLSYMLSSPRDPDVSIGQGEIQQGTSNSSHQHFSTVFLTLDLILGTCSFFSRYMNVLTRVTGHTHVTSQAVGKHLLQVTLSVLSRFRFLSNPTSAELQS